MHRPTQVFLRAAEFMSTGEAHHGCCEAIHRSGWEYSDVVYFGRMFMPEGFHIRWYWFGPPQWEVLHEHGVKPAQTLRETRVYALLIAANAWEDFV